MNPIIFIIVPLIAFLILGLNVLLAPHKPYDSKISQYESGMPVSPGQTRSTFHVHFFLVALLFLVFDIELLSIYPLALTLYQVSSFGFSVGMIFFFILTLGFVLEIGSGAIKLTSLDFNFKKSPTAKQNIFVAYCKRLIRLLGLISEVSEAYRFFKINLWKKLLIRYWLGLICKLLLLIILLYLPLAGTITNIDYYLTCGFKLAWKFYYMGIQNINFYWFYPMVNKLYNYLTIVSNLWDLDVTVRVSENINIILMILDRAKYVFINYWLTIFNKIIYICSCPWLQIILSLIYIFYIWIMNILILYCLYISNYNNIIYLILCFIDKFIFVYYRKYKGFFKNKKILLASPMMLLNQLLHFNKLSLFLQKSRFLIKLQELNLFLVRELCFVSKLSKGYRFYITIFLSFIFFIIITDPILYAFQNKLYCNTMLISRLCLLNNPFEIFWCIICEYQYLYFGNEINSEFLICNSKNYIWDYLTHKSNSLEGDITNNNISLENEYKPLNTTESQSPYDGYLKTFSINIESLEERLKEVNVSKEEVANALLIAETVVEQLSNNPEGILKNQDLISESGRAQIVLLQTETCTDIYANSFQELGDKVEIEKNKNPSSKENWSDAEEF